MKEFGLTLVLALLWAAAMGSIDLANLATGFILAYLVLWALRPARGGSSYFKKLPQAIGFALYFLRELVLSNIRVAIDVLSPRPRRRPAVVAVPLDCGVVAAVSAASTAFWLPSRRMTAATMDLGSVNRMVFSVE